MGWACPAVGLAAGKRSKGPAHGFAFGNIWQQLTFSAVVTPYRTSAPQGTRPCYRLNAAGNSTCGKQATKSQRKVLRSSPWARHLLLLYPSLTRGHFLFVPGSGLTVITT